MKSISGYAFLAGPLDVGITIMICCDCQGARKIVKKFDKFNGTSHCGEYMSTCQPLVSMQHEARTNLSAMISDVEKR